MSFLSTEVSTTIGRVILFLLVAVLIVVLILVYLINPTTDPASVPSKIFTVVAGVLSGLMVMLGQYIIELKKDRDLNVFRETRIKTVLLTRDDEEYYRRLIAKATIRIDVLGVTASRFLADFADKDNPRAEKRVLLDALQRNVKVRILVGNKRHLESDADKRKHDSAKPNLERLRNEFPDVFEYGYYNHPPAHSIVVVDSDCLVGPVLPGLDSKVTPAVHTEYAGPFAAPYVKYFNAEWDKAD
jgi:hypothetical protein